MTLLVLALLTAIPPPTALAQDQGSNQIVITAPGAPVTIGWDHIDDANLRYRLWCNKAIVKNFAPTEIVRTPGRSDGQTGVTITAVVTTIPAGANSCWVTAYSDIGGSIIESDPSNVLALPVGVKPPPPGNFRRIMDQIKALLDELVSEMERRDGSMIR